jgi:pimeloyl-ACP methyl ester carboxylesterase
VHVKRKDVVFTRNLVGAMLLSYSMILGFARTPAPCLATAQATSGVQLSASNVFPETTEPFFFDPLETFELQEPQRPPARRLPLLLMLPGLDGSGVTAWTQYPELGLSYDLLAMRIPPDDRSSFSTIVDMVVEQIEAARADGRSVFLLGESMGAGVALHVATRAIPDGLILVSPATGWDRTWVGRTRHFLVGLPDALLGFCTLLTSYQHFDLEQVWTTTRRIVTGERSPLLDTPLRFEYAWRLVNAMPEAFAQPAGTVRHRIAAWTEETLAIGREATFSSLDLPPLLIIAGTADLRVPAEEEAWRLQACAKGPCDVQLVPKAGHSGVTDDRIDLRDVLDRWRAERVKLPHSQPDAVQGGVVPTSIAKPRVCSENI